MLIKKLPHILVTLLVVFLVGCGGTTNPLIDQAKSNIETGNNDALLKTAEESIDQYPSDPRGYFYKGLALGNIGESQENPADRGDYYKQMNESFEMAKAVDDTTEGTPDEMSRIMSSKGGFYDLEYKRGVDFYQDDSLKSTVENPLERSMQHFKNATIILPEQAGAWNALATMSAINKNFEQALDAKSKYMSMVPDTAKKVDDYLQFGSFYRQLNKPKDALGVYEEGSKQFPENSDLVANIMGTYMDMGQPKKAISMLESLIEQDPENSDYRLKMGSEIFNQALAIQDSMIANSNEILKLQEQFKNAEEADKKDLKDKIMGLSDKNKELKSVMNQYLDRSEKEVKTALEYASGDAAAYETLGIIHRFRAQIVTDEYNRTPSDQNEKAAKLKEQRNELLTDAMGYYEKAVEIQPDNKNYWKSLFQIYATLGLDKKAQEAMEKAGLN